MQQKLVEEIAQAERECVDTRKAALEKQINQYADKLHKKPERLRDRRNTWSEVKVGHRIRSNDARKDQSLTNIKSTDRGGTDMFIIDDPFRLPAIGKDKQIVEF